MRILVDLSMLRHPYCGLGQVARSYGEWYAARADAIPAGCEVTLLVPQAYVGAFGQRVRYLVARDLYRFFPGLMPRFDLWHSIHQLSPFRPPATGGRRVLTIHDVNFMYEKQGAKRQRYLRRLQAECDAADELCFISRFAMEDARRVLDFGSKTPHVVYNGVPDMTTGAQEPVPEAVGAPFLLSIGVVKAKKNLHVLLPMMERLPDWRLVIAGDDSDPYARQLRQQLAAHGNVVMVGRVGDAQRRWLYAHCGALLFPSLAEGFGLPVIEAMQWGKPVFCSDRTSLPEVGGGHAFYFRSFEAEAMAAVVRQGLASFDGAAADAARRHEASFSVENMMNQYWKLYNIE